jgi:SAM-dependent methyltransferase
MNTTLKALKRRIKSMMLKKEERRHAMVGPSELWKMKRDFQFQFLKTMGLSPEHYFLDIGCGTLRGGIPLINYLQKGHYYGVEVREEVLEEGRKELREAGLEEKKPILLHSSDFSQLMIDQQFDYAWAFSVLIHMSDDILGQTLDFVSKHLADGGAFYANVNVGERKEGSWQGFPVVWRTLEHYSSECSRSGLVLSDLGVLKDHGHVSNVDAQDNQTMLRISKE